MQLAQLSDQLTNNAQAIGNHLVTVHGRHRHPATGIAWSSDTVVTANHVVQRDEDLSVVTPSGGRTSAALVGRDPSTDLAVLRLEGDLPGGDLAAPEWYQGEGLAPAQLVLAVARPDGDVQASLGVLAAVRGPWMTGAGGRVDAYLQPDLVMYPGFSGGALVDAEGRVIGLNTSALLRGATASLPQSTVSRVAETLIAHGRMRRGYLGVSVQPVRLPAEVAQALDQRTGALLVSVEEGSPAAGAGLHLGDVIVSVASDRIRELDDLLAVLTGDRIGQAVPVRFVRGGEVRTLDVTIAERGETE